MSVSAHARALVRRRASLARLIDREVCTEHAAHVRFLARGTFDVAAARAYALELIALEDEHAVFTDWTVSKGSGPDNREPGAFVEPTTWANACDGCGGHGCFRLDAEDALWGVDEAEVCLDCDGTGAQRGGWPGKLAREWPGDRRAPQGRSLARVGRRLLEALEGQPDDIWAYAMTLGERDRLAVDGWLVGEWTWVGPVKIWPMSRRNLAGYLPEVSRPARIRRKVADEMRARETADLPTDETAGTLIHVQLTETTPGWAAGLVTRVVPRGEHRDEAGLALALSPRVCAKLRGLGLNAQTVGERVNLRGWVPHDSPAIQVYTVPGQESEYPKRFKSRDLAPRWRRGELLHAQQRREREAPRAATGEHLDELGAAFDRERRQGEPDDEYRGRLLEAQSAALGRGSLTPVTQSLTQTPAREG